MYKNNFSKLILIISETECFIKNVASLKKNELL